MYINTMNTYLYTQIDNILPPKKGSFGGAHGSAHQVTNLVMMARCGGCMQAPMKRTTFSWRVCR